jgi:hypothetical protein
MLQGVMNTEKHPLMAHLKSTGESLAAFARRTEMSRMQLYRIMAGENTTLDRLMRISNATEGKVTLNDFARSEVQQ